MVTTLNFKSVIDLPKWRPLAAPPLYSAAGINIVNTCDLRNNEDRSPFIYHFMQILNAQNQLAIYNIKTDEWSRIAVPAAIGGGSVLAAATMMPSQGPRGTLAAGATTTTVTLTTALAAAVQINQLANRGDGRGYKIRIIGNAAGSSGKTEERYIVGNTSGTTPTITLDSALTFTPILGDAYEFLSGKLYFVATTNLFINYDLLTGISTNLTNTGIAVNEICLVPLDELYVPYDRNPGEGFFGILTATATAAATLTGQAVGGDASVLANEHRNFQIRIVEDVATPTAVGQRRNITSHTAGASPVYTVAAWTVQPSATAKYVIENNGDRIIMFQSGSTTIYNYTISTNAWSAAIWTNSINTPGNGLSFWAHQAFGIEPDTNKNVRHSFIYFTIGAGYRYLDIAGGATGAVSAAVTSVPPYFTTGFVPLGSAAVGQIASVQDPVTNQGRYLYFTNLNPGVNVTNVNQPQRLYRFDMRNSVLEMYGYLRFPTISAITSPNFAPYRTLAFTSFIDGSTKLGFLINTPLATSNAQVLAFGLPIIN